MTSPTPPKGERGDFRKVTLTLPPQVYDALVQESARRKSAGAPDHLLSAIAREWFAHRQCLLPIEKTELAIYVAADLLGRGEWRVLGNFDEFRRGLSEPSTKVLVDLMIDMVGRGWILLEKFSQEAGCY